MDGLIEACSCPLPPSLSVLMCPQSVLDVSDVTLPDPAVAIHVTKPTHHHHHHHPQVSRGDTKQRPTEALRVSGGSLLTAILCLSPSRDAALR
jgi:hypothetical protein